MQAVQIIFQILSGILLVVAILQKEKWKMLLVYAVNNIVLAIVFFSFSRVATASICLVGGVRMLVYMIYAIKNLKPNAIWLVLFSIAFVVSTALTWQDALDLMPLIAILSSNFGSWQDNQVVLRISFIINGLLYVIYEAIIGAYIALAVEGVNLICTIISFVYYCILKREKPIFEAIFKRKEKNYLQTDEIDLK